MDLSVLWNWWALSALPAIDDALRQVLPEAWEPYTFMRYALIECVLLTPICAAMGVKVVNFRLAFFSDAISHSAIAGVAIGFLLHELTQVFDPRVAMITFGLIIGLGIAIVRRKTDLSSDTIVGVFFSTVVALGIAIITTRRQTQSFETYLYGDILTLDPADLGLSALLAVLVMGFMILNFNRLVLVGLNAELAHSRGVAVKLHDYLFSLLLALVVTTSIRTAGILLVTALLVVPAAAARNVARTAAGMFWWAMLLGLTGGLAGTFLSFRLDNVGTGAVIVLATASLFALSLLVRRR